MDDRLFASARDGKLLDCKSLLAQGAKCVKSSSSHDQAPLLMHTWHAN